MAPGRASGARPPGVRRWPARAGHGRGDRHDVPRRPPVAAGHAGAHPRPARRRRARRPGDPAVVVAGGLGRGDVRRGVAVPVRGPVGAAGKPLERESRCRVETGCGAPRGPISSTISPSGSDRRAAASSELRAPSEGHYPVSANLPSKSTCGPHIGRHDREKFAPIRDGAGSGYRDRRLQRELLRFLRRGHAANFDAAAGNRHDGPVLPRGGQLCPRPGPPGHVRYRRT